MRRGAPVSGERHHDGPRAAGQCPDRCDDLGRPGYRDDVDGPAGEQGAQVGLAGRLAVDRDDVNVQPAEMAVGFLAWVRIPFLRRAHEAFAHPGALGGCRAGKGNDQGEVETVGVRRCRQRQGEPRRQATRRQAARTGAQFLRMRHMKLLYRHALVAGLALAVSLPFWFGRLEWDPEMRLWRAIGDGSFVLLFLTLLLGPAARHWPAAARLLPWRRELGIWFAVLALVHTLLVLDGWVRWEWMRFFGYEFIPPLARYARLEPGFGLSNLLGIIAAIIALPLMITSSDWAVRRLGAASWKWLHYGAYTVFYLAALHTLYFLFMHYSVSLHRPVPPPNWFRYPSLVMAALVLAVQMSAFVATLRRRRQGERPA